MYVVIVGAGKVGWNLARELINKRHEVTVIEADAQRYAVVEQELEHSAMYGDGSELWVLERSGIERADLVVAVTGDDEDNILISQVAREKYGVARNVARCNNPRNLQHFELLGVKPVISATDLILRLIEHEVPKYGLVHLLDLPEERLEIIELEVAEGSEAAGRAVKDLGLPDGSLVISILRDGGGFVPAGDSIVQAGDEVLLVLEVGDLDGIYYLRTFANSDAIFAEGDRAERVVLVGGSYIATEVAASLTAAHGVKCSLVMLEDVTLDRFYGREVGGFFQRALEDHGVEVHGAQEVERFEGADGRVRKVVTKSGLSLDCDAVVIGAGVTPDITLARQAGLEIGDAGGVKGSAGLETSAPGIFAAGDICEYDSPIHGRPMRIEHWDVAFNQGKTAALNMLGRGVEHDVVPYFFSDLADWTWMEYVGPGSGDTVIRGSLDEADFTAFYVDGGRVTAALTVGRSDDLEHARRFIVERPQVDPAALADEGTDLASL